MDAYQLWVEMCHDFASASGIKLRAHISDETLNKLNREIYMRLQVRHYRRVGAYVLREVKRKQA